MAGGGWGGNELLRYAGLKSTVSTNEFRVNRRAARGVHRPFLELGGGF